VISAPRRYLPLPLFPLRLPLLPLVVCDPVLLMCMVMIILDLKTSQMLKAWNQTRMGLGRD
jgi:hypothetical protein